MTHRIPIEQITTQFERCHRSVLAHLEKTRKIARQTHPHHDLMQAWQDLYNIRVHRGRGWGNWEALEFPTEQAYMIWLMRWS